MKRNILSWVLVLGILLSQIMIPVSAEESLRFPVRDLAYEKSTWVYNSWIGGTGGNYIEMSGGGIGHWISLTIPVPSPGGYFRVTTGSRSSISRAIASLEIDGNPYTSDIDMYRSSSINVAIPHDEIIYLSEGNHTFRYTVTGKNEAANNDYKLGLDYIDLVPVISPELDPLLAADVDALIDEIGDIRDITLDSGPVIRAARSAYDVLTVDQKALVTKYETLETAEQRLAEILEDLEPNADVNEVIELIDDIGEVEYTPESKLKIKTAREAYDALSFEQNHLVTNYDLLIMAENDYLSLERNRSEPLTFYVSNSGNDNADGYSQDTAWATIERVNEGRYIPGDAILFRAGDKWENITLQPEGSGAEGQFIVIGRYGEGNKPLLAGNAQVSDVIHLHNQDYWEIQGLEITNKADGYTGVRNSDNGSKLGDFRGIHITGQDVPSLTGFHLHDLYIHDVSGKVAWINGLHDTNTTNYFENGLMYNTGWDNSKRTGGILVECLQPTGTTATVFKNVTLENSVLAKNSFGGFTIKQWNGGASGPKWALRSTAATAPEYYDPNWKPHENIVVRGNYIDQTGDYNCNGIYVTSSKGILVENNVVKNAGVCGIELYFADDAIIQNNEVYGARPKAGGADSNGIDPDRQTTNTIIQYNYVHNNGDGMLICGFDYNSVIVRYNLLKDNTGIWLHEYLSGGLVEVYNNIFYNTLNQGTLQFSNASASSMEVWKFRNNVFYNTNQSVTASYYGGASQYNDYDTNLFYGPGVTPYGTNAINTNPLFVDPNAAFGTGDSVANRVWDFSALKPASGSPLIKAGVKYAQDTTKIQIVQNSLDYAGTEIADNPAIGLFEAKFDGALSGFVYNAYNERVSGATVEVEGFEPVQTNEDGFYSISNITVGDYTITVSKDGYEGSTEEVTITDETGGISLSVGKLLDDKRVVSGTVKDRQGDGIAGVAVTVKPSGSVEYTTQTGENGSYLIENVPIGFGYTVEASKLGYSSSKKEDVTVTREGAVVDFRLRNESDAFYYLYEDFNEYDTGSFTSSDLWQVQKSGTGEISIVSDSGNNKLLKMNRGNSSPFYIYNKKDLNTTGIFTIQMRVKRTSTSANQYGLYTYNSAYFNASSPVGSNPSATIALTGGDIRSHNVRGSSSTITAGKYTADNWNVISNVVNMDTGTFDFYIDGERILRDQPLRTWSAAGFDLDRLVLFSTDGAEDLFVDYIIVYEGKYSSSIPTPLTGVLAITGTVKFGGILQADVSGVKPVEAVATLDYSWTRSGEPNPVGDGSSYTITADDVGKTLTLTVTGTGDYSGTLTAATADVGKESQAIPTGLSAINETTVGGNNGKILGTTGVMEYSVKDSGVWADCSDSETTGLAPGTYLVRYKTSATHEASDSVEVTIATHVTGAIHVTGVSLNLASASLYTNQSPRTLQLAATVLPDDAADKTVTWTSSNAGVATVDQNGLVMAVSSGTATITVTTTDGNKQASCTVAVTTYYDDSPTTPPPTTPPSEQSNPGEKLIAVEPKVDKDGTAKAEVKEDTIKKQLESLKKEIIPEGVQPVIVIKAEAPTPETKAVEVVLPAEAAAQIAEQANLTIDTGFSMVTFDKKALETIISAKGGSEQTGNITVAVAVADKSKLSEKELKMIGDRPVFDFKVYNGETQVSDFQGGKASIRIPYALGEGENPNAILVYYIGDDGEVKRVLGQYNAETGTVDVAVTHFSVYAVAYNLVEFSDVPKNVPYYDAVTFLAARGITNGIGDGKYGSNHNLTRAMFIVMMMRAFDIEPDASPTDNFADANDTWYTGYLAAAKRLGISYGVGNNLFAPDQSLTEWQLYTFLERTLETLGAPGFNSDEEKSYTATVNRAKTAEVLYEVLAPR